MLRPLMNTKHPDKTFVGRIEKGFDFLGYHFHPDEFSLAKKPVENFLARAIRLYEQELEGAFRLHPAWSVCAAMGRVVAGGISSALDSGAVN